LTEHICKGLRAICINVAINVALQPTCASLKRSSGFRASPPELTPFTVITLRQDYMVPLRECFDGSFFYTSMGDFSERLCIISTLTENDTQAFLAGESTSYGAKRRVDAAAPRPLPRKDRKLRALPGKVLDLEKLLGRKINQIKKCLATLRTRRPSKAKWRGMPPFTKRW